MQIYFLTLEDVLEIHTDQINRYGGKVNAIEGAVRLYLKNKEPIPEPIKKEQFKGQIAYRTTSERHFHVAKAAKTMHKSISKTIDELIDTGLDRLNMLSY